MIDIIVAIGNGYRNHAHHHNLVGSNKSAQQTRDVHIHYSNPTCSTPHRSPGQDTKKKYPQTGNIFTKLAHRPWPYASHAMTELLRIVVTKSLFETHTFSEKSSDISILFASMSMELAVKIDKIKQTCEVGHDCVERSEVECTFSR